MSRKSGMVLTALLVLGGFTGASLAQNQVPQQEITIYSGDDAIAPPVGPEAIMPPESADQNFTPTPGQEPIMPLTDDDQNFTATPGEDTVLLPEGVAAGGGAGSPDSVAEAEAPVAKGALPAASANQVYDTGPVFKKVGD